MIYIYIYIHTYIHTYTLWIESMWEYQEGWSLLRHPMERDRIVGFWQSLNMQRKLNEVPPERNPSKCLCLSWEMWHLILPETCYEVPYADRSCCNCAVARSSQDDNHKVLLNATTRKNLEMDSDEETPFVGASRGFHRAPWPSTCGICRPKVEHRVNPKVEQNDSTNVCFQHLHCWLTCTCLPAHKTACCTQFFNSPVLS